MHIVAIAALSVLCAALALRLYSAEKSLRGLTRQLREREVAGASVRLRLEAPNRAAEELLATVNALLERQERESADYRRQEAAIRQQIANVSHDLRTPLTSILGYLQLLEGDTLTPEERREYLHVVQSRAVSLQSLITGFYDLSRLEGGEYPLTREPVDLYLILSRLAAEFYNDFAERGFTVAVELAEGLPPVMGDPSGILRVFTNLIRNALEHGEKRLEIRLSREGDQLSASVANDAAPLTQEDLSHIFDRFYTADKMRTGRSTGLGLAIVKTLAQRMGCAVRADYRDGTFRVTVGWKL